VAGRIELSVTFALLDQTKRANTVRVMILSLVTPPGEANELAEWDTAAAQTRKAKASEGKSGTGYN